MLIKIIIIMLLIGILASLAVGLVHLIRDPSESKGTVKSLTWRISLSFLTIAVIITAYVMGWITPHM